MTYSDILFHGLIFPWTDNIITKNQFEQAKRGFELAMIHPAEAVLLNADNLLRYLEERLYEWAHWYGRGNFAGLGYPAYSLEYRIMTESNVFRPPGAQPRPIHSDAEEIERLVSVMAQHNPGMAQALRCQYFRQGAVCDKAKKSGLSHTQFKQDVDRAHQWLLARLRTHSQQT